jgi:hypothetical protein
MSKGNAYWTRVTPLIDRLEELRVGSLPEETAKGLCKHIGLEWFECIPCADMQKILWYMMVNTDSGLTFFFQLPIV